jgi:hypothetical protein
MWALQSQKAEVRKDHTAGHRSPVTPSNEKGGRSRLSLVLERGFSVRRQLE